MGEEVAASVIGEAAPVTDEVEWMMLGGTGVE